MWSFIKKYPKKSTLESGIDIGQEINIEPEKCGKKLIFSKKLGTSLQKLFQSIVIEWYCLKHGKKVVSL